MAEHKFLDNITSLRISDGIMTIPGKTEGDIKKIRSFLHESLLDYKIPYTKVIGVDVPSGAAVVVPDMVSPTSVGFSYIMLGEILSDVILPSIKDGVFCEIAFTGRIESNGRGIRVGGVGESPTLLKDRTILDLEGSLAVIGIAMTGTGSLDFSETSKNISTAKRVLPGAREVIYKPLRADYDLSKYLNIRPFTGGSDIELVYSHRVDEKVLATIFLDYIEKCAGGN